MHERSLKSQLLPKGKAIGDYVPVYAALGMIALSAALGLHAIKHHFVHDPGVHVKKSRRESLPEVTEPDYVAQESTDFIRKSFFRKVAHIQEFKTPLDAPFRGNPLDRYGIFATLCLKLLFIAIS